MKKIYICPLLTVFEIQAQTTILTGSETTLHVEEGTYTGTFNAKQNSFSSYSVWDDDWSAQ